VRRVCSSSGAAAKAATSRANTCGRSGGNWEDVRGRTCSEVKARMELMWWERRAGGG
jgi:hypothetical protein